MGLQNYPLAWPDGWQRTPPSYRKNGQFGKTEKQYSGDHSWSRKKDLTVMDAIQRVLQELTRMGFTRDDVLISTNLATRLDGLPRSDQRKPLDPGVAVYWRRGGKGEMRCIAIDIYNEVADNLAAIAATLEAMRAIERHGGAQVQERTFRGFAALPGGQRPWREVLEIQSDFPSREQIESHFRVLLKKHHPDVGGSDAAMSELNAAREEALRQVREEA